MIVSIGDKIIKNISFIQITYGKLIDFRRNNNIIYGTSIKEQMIFIHNDTEENYEINKNLTVLGDDQ